MDPLVEEEGNGSLLLIYCTDEPQAKVESIQRAYEREISSSGGRHCRPGFQLEETEELLKSVGVRRIQKVAGTHSMMDKDLHTGKNGQPRPSTSSSGSSEIELHNWDDGMDGQAADSGQEQERGNGDLEVRVPESHNGSKRVGRRKSRKERSLKSWALTEEEPHPCCGTWTCCCWNGSLDSVGCPLAPPSDVYEILHHSRLVLGAYGTDIDDLEKLIQAEYPKFSKKIVVKFEHPNIGEHYCPPFFICVDDERREVGLYMRGLNLLHKTDYVALMSNRKHEKEFKGGYVHDGMGTAAVWCLAHIGPDLKEQLLKHKGYRLTLVGHSLGAGVCALLAALLVEDREAVGGIDSDLIRAYAIAPARVLSLNLAARYAPNIYSVIYQDDFLPRVSTSAAKRVVFAAFALTGAVLFLYWLVQEMKKKPVSDDVYRLYPPGQILHVVYRQPGVYHDMPIQVRVVDSAQGRFDRIILTSSGTAVDHSVLKLARHLKTYDWPPEFRNKI